MGAPHSPHPPPVHMRGGTNHAHTQPHKETKTPSPTNGGALTTPREHLTNPLPPTIPTHHPRGVKPLERLKIASRICVTHAPIYVHARAGLHAGMYAHAPGSDPAHLDTHNAPAQRLFFDWGKKKPRSMAGLRVCICGLSRTRCTLASVNPCRVVRR
jgi:hypothetical protein